MNTRDQILASAWNLFTERGFEDVSVRDVTSDAGVNLASVNYHFGSKDGLIQEVVKQVLNPMNAARMESLKTLIEQTGSIDNVSLRQVVECYVRPMAFPEEHGGNHDILAMLAARYLIKRNYDIPLSVNQHFADVFQNFVIVIATKVPHMEKDAILRALMFTVGAALHYQSFAEIAQKIKGEEPALDREESFNSLIDFVLPGFER
ncbi:TetR/AcrR family transcriptional regulator [Rubritalea marina]|uniref:TetR/AcrR family transcriptional regulator n=1 Tax=Rubritalea marina TaxID=361055 RepID=UPI000374DF91|nr:TetR/AcrR family transcriptional regulator [Rubritalea marina]